MENILDIQSHLVVEGINGYTVNIDDWADALSLVAQLQMPEAKNKFDFIVISISEIALKAEEQVCASAGVASLLEIPGGLGHERSREMVEDFFGGILGEDYEIVENRMLEMLISAIRRYKPRDPMNPSGALIVRTESYLKSGVTRGKEAIEKQRRR